GGCGFPPRDHDVREELVLRQIDDPAPVEIEQRDERDDREADRGLVAEERSEAHSLLRRHHSLELGGALLDRVALARGNDVLLALARSERDDARPCGLQRVDLAASRRQLDRAALAMEGTLAGA